MNVMRFKLLATAPPRGKNNLLISHTHGSPRNEERVMGGMQEAGIVVYQPDGRDGAEAVARIPAVEWDNLLGIQKMCGVDTICLSERLLMKNEVRNLIA